VGRVNGLGYNPAVEAKGFTAEQAKRVRSKDKTHDFAMTATLPMMKAAQAKV
jgi:sterol carrier protein 2